MRQDQFLLVLDRDEARRRWHAALRLDPLGDEEVALDAALGRVLAHDVASPLDVPGFDRSNVDGFAVRAEDTFGATEDAPRRLRLLDEEVAVGALPAGEVTAGFAMAIPTGGALPRGADAVVMVEHTELSGGALLVTKPVTPGRMVTFAGTDVARGEVVLRRGEPLTSRETGVLAAIGISRVRVHRRPRVAVLSTGDELVAPGRPLAPGTIHDSNAVILADAVRELGGEPVPLGIVPDRLDRVQGALRAALATADVVLLSGGTSKGPGDLNVRALEEVLEPPGIVAHGVALKPGKPLCLASSGGKPVVVLPGFPTSAIFTFHDLVAEVVHRLGGASAEEGSSTDARLPFRVLSDRGRTEFVLVRLVDGPGGGLAAYPIGKGSGSVTTFSQADGFVVIDRHVEILEAGETVRVRPVAGARPRRADLVVIGSHCVGLDVLLGLLRELGVTSKVIAVGSEGGLAAAARGECDAAGVHLLDVATGRYNLPFLPPGVVLREGYGRLQGVVHRRGDPRFAGLDAEGVARAALADPDAVVVNRNRGSGTRALYDRLLGDARPRGHGVEATSHHAVAAAVAQGRADWGIAIDVCARMHDLAFAPLAEERFDFALPEARLTRPAVRAFLDVLASPRARDALREQGFLA